MSDVDRQDMQERRDAATYVVSEYEAGNLLRPQALAGILDNFIDLGLDGGDLQAAISPFVQLLDDIDKTRAARQTRSPARSEVGRREARRVSRDRPFLDEEEGRRAASDAGGGDDETGGDWPWSRKATVTDPDLAKTLKLRRRYQDQLEKAKAAIVTSVGAPTFPETLWTAILKHGYVDFDKLNGAHYSAVNEEEGQPAYIGDYSIRVKSKSASKPVTTSTDWLYCYEAYERAVVWAYPHRRKELQAYYRQFHELFRSYTSPAHIRLINLDRAIRSEVASSSLLKLDDPHLFTRLREQYLSPDGAGYQASSSTNVRKTSGSSGGSSGGSGSGGSGRSRTKLQEPCRQWNAGRCVRPEASCLYVHKCIDCAGGHPQTSCPQTAPGTGGRAKRQE